MREFEREYERELRERARSPEMTRTLNEIERQFSPRRQKTDWGLILPPILAILLIAWLWSTTPAGKMLITYLKEVLR